MAKLAEDYPMVFVKYHKGFEALFNQMRIKNGKQVPGVHWLCGPTGCGKTRTSIEESIGCPWMSGDSLKWFDGYEDQSTAIIDDFRKEHCTFSFFLRVIDRY